MYVVFFFKAETGIRGAHEWLEFRRVLFRSDAEPAGLRPSRRRAPRRPWHRRRPLGRGGGAFGHRCLLDPESELSAAPAGGGLPRRLWLFRRRRPGGRRARLRREPVARGGGAAARPRHPLPPPPPPRGGEIGRAHLCTP